MQTQEMVDKLRGDLVCANKGAEEELQSMLAQLKSTEESERIALIDVRRAMCNQAELLAVRSRELTDALALVPREGFVSCSETIAMVDGLTQEMTQIYAWVEDACSRGREATQDQRDVAATVLQGYLGPTMTELLRSTGTTAQASDRLVVQLAIQAYFVQLTHSLVGSWIPMTTPHAINCFVAYIYEETSQSDIWYIFPQWRELASLYGKNSVPTTALMLNQAEFINHIVVCALLLGGIQVDENKLPGMEVEERMKNILDLCMRLRDAMGEGDVSRAFCR
ncbi:hypothetical protein PHLGIDRAFT_247056 [Phlebiopsis gigantea 11061_1 CR5-6]|uniref:Uncharacterized protein n=1 Tax=Phlebiopsis gigantea (strain 11061_1 CR5-6) TaxID=745531 RepID=A0A0C3S1P4_PHLG1|nr:hypothetical protein PHLGIDRAFT_247056 [Phlebiopsis gigantea 11061_1 CR5-6]